MSQDGENGAEIHMLANTMKQARLLFDESKAMIKSPVLKKTLDHYVMPFIMIKRYLKLNRKHQTVKN